MHATFQELLPILQNAAKRWVTNLEVDPENEPALRYVLAWSCAHPSFDGDAGKGLLLMGHRGTGKTLMMQALALCMEGSLRFDFHNTRKITSAYNCEGDEGIRKFSAMRHMLFDDLGDERMGQHYGDKVEVMSLVIQDRYELFTDHGIMSHFTTNLSPDEIRSRYGARVYSRLLHMVNSFRVGSEVDAVDRRASALAPPRRIVEVYREPLPVEAPVLRVEKDQEPAEKPVPDMEKARRVSAHIEKLRKQLSVPDEIKYSA